MNPTDTKYVGILSIHLDRYAIKSRAPFRANLRCPICGDSTKSKSKTRGWILEKNNRGWYYCHNCGASMSFQNFLKRISPSIYDDYMMELFGDKFKKRELPELPVETSKPKFDKSPLKKIKKISALKSNHPVKQYVESRKIPVDKHYMLYYAPKFNSWVNSMIPKKLNPDKDEPRLVIPMLDEKNRLFGFAGRSFDPNADLRYITIMLDDVPKIFGLNSVDFSKKYYITEGQIDSLFLDNAIAMAGADGNTHDLTGDYVFVFDNEPRNIEVVKHMEKVIERGDKIVIWPNLPFKDINLMVQNGYTPEQVEKMLDSHTYSGLDAKLALMIWKRC